MARRSRIFIGNWGCGKNVRSQLIKLAQESLEKALSDSVPDQALIKVYTTNLEKLYREEELFWRQRSRIQWLHSGDRNTAYFHAATRSRRAVNNVSVIEDELGNEYHDEDQIASTISQYYQTIFTAGQRSNNTVVEEGLSPK
ncbi:unnamed protein product, partial [Arabidopsis halleri]